MISYQTTSANQIVVTAFMRWPLLSTLVAGSIWSTQYLPESVTEAMMEACNHVCSDVCTPPGARP